MYVMCLSVCLCVVQPSPSTVLVCSATQDPPDYILSVCLSVCLQAHCLLPGEMYKGVHCLPEIVTAAMDFEDHQQRK